MKIQLFGISEQLNVKGIVFIAWLLLICNAAGCAQQETVESFYAAGAVGSLSVQERHEIICNMYNNTTANANIRGYIENNCIKSVQF
jgi:hypothetical protein